MWSGWDESVRLEGIGGEDMHVPDKVSSIWEGLEAGESMETVRKVGRKARGNTQGWPGNGKWRDNQEEPCRPCSDD